MSSARLAQYVGNVPVEITRIHSCGSFNVDPVTKLVRYNHSASLVFKPTLIRHYTMWDGQNFKHWREIELRQYLKDLYVYHKLKYRSLRKFINKLTRITDLFARLP